MDESDEKITVTWVRPSKPRDIEDGIPAASWTTTPSSACRTSLEVCVSPARAWKAGESASSRSLACSPFVEG